MKKDLTNQTELIRSCITPGGTYPYELVDNLLFTIESSKQLSKTKEHGHPSAIVFNFKEARFLLGKTQREVAKLSGVSIWHISRLENRKKTDSFQREKLKDFYLSQ